MPGLPAGVAFSCRRRKVTEYELTYTDVVPKDQQAVTTKKIEEDRHHEVISSGLSMVPATLLKPCVQ